MVQSERRGATLYIPDILLSYGDFLCSVACDRSGAEDQYLRARGVASDHEFYLLRAAAQRRLRVVRTSPQPPSLAQLLRA